MELTTSSGRRVPMRALRVDPKTGSAGRTIPLDLGDVTAVRLVGSARGDVLEAPLTHAR